MLVKLLYSIKADTSLNFPIEVAVTNNINNEIKAGMYGSVVLVQERLNSLKSCTYLEILLLEVLTAIKFS